MHLLMAMALLAAGPSQAPYDAPYQAMSQAVVVTAVANMYAQPGEDGEVVSQAIYASTIGAFRLAARPHRGQLYRLDAGH